MSADWDDDGVDVRALRENLQSHCPLARDQVVVVEGVDEGRAHLLFEQAGVLIRILEGRAM